MSGFRLETHKNLEGYRSYLEKVNTVPVETNARVPHGPEVKGMNELKEYLKKEREEDIAENLIRRFLSYSLGRKLTYRDRFEIETLLAETQKTNHSFQDIILAICQSQSFRKTNSTTPKK